ncbi:MAG: M48 family metallopeptidase [Bacteroidales bacterium]|nr:M48 family metallopeptidase [Bacteroidales bacterium]
MSTISEIFRLITKKATNTISLNPTIELEKQLSQQIYNALQGDVVNEILSQLTDSGSDTWWRSNMEGHSLKVEKELLPDMYRLCQSVKETLNFTEPVDFYITGDSMVNAFSVASEKEGVPHIVNINSGLMELMTKEELRFVIGHELGHLINRDTALARLINFVFPEDSHAPITLQYKIRLHSQLAELVADRYGYMATGDLEACVTAFFKMASGLDLLKMNVSIEALLEDNLKHLEYFLNDKGLSRATHPVNPIRVQAINLFARSESQEELEQGMEQLISILLKVGNDEQDEYLARFIATAGLIVANTDEEVTKEEIDAIVEHLAALKIFPMAFLEEISQGDVPAIFKDAVEHLMEINPGLREGMFNYMINIVISNHNITKEELELLNSFGASVGFSNIEIANMMASAIQLTFVPSLDAIS